MTEMIAAEPALTERLIRRLARDPEVEALAAHLRDASAAGLPIVTTGCGTSHHAALGVADLLTEALGAAPGREVRAVQALEAQRRPLRDGLLIGVSHEGGTEATNGAIRAANEAGARTALITVSTRSPGAELANVIVATEEQDQSWCHTVGYLSPLLAGVALARRVSGTRTDAIALRAQVDAANDHRAAADVAAGLSGIDRLIVIGSGPDHVSALELTLKVAEGARLPAQAFELETIHHGHLAAATRWTGLLLVLTDPTAPPTVAARATRALAAARALGMPAAAILGEKSASAVPSGDTPAGRIVIPKMGRVSGAAASLLGAAVPLQLLAERLARARSVNPDTLGREDEAQAAAHN